MIHRNEGRVMIMAKPVEEKRYISLLDILKPLQMEYNYYIIGILAQLEREQKDDTDNNK